MGLPPGCRMAHRRRGSHAAEPLQPRQCPVSPATMSTSMAANGRRTPSGRGDTERRPRRSASVQFPKLPVSRVRLVRRSRRPRVISFNSDFASTVDVPAASQFFHKPELFSNAHRSTGDAIVRLRDLLLQVSAIQVACRR